MFANIITERIKNMTYRTPMTAVDKLSWDSIVSRLVRPNTDHIRWVDALNKLEKITVIVRYFFNLTEQFSNVESWWYCGSWCTSMNYLPGRSSLCAKADSKKHETQYEYRNMKHSTQCILNLKRLLTYTFFYEGGSIMREAAWSSGLGRWIWNLKVFGANPRSSRAQLLDGVV